MATLTIKIAEAGTPLLDDKGNSNGNSLAGHVWYTLDAGDSQKTDCGFGPIDPTIIGAGETKKDDSTRYLETAYERTVEITDEQYSMMKDFYEHPDKYGFDVGNYNALTNSCVDFVWRALDVAGFKTRGLNTNGYNGTLLPIDNINSIEYMLDPLSEYMTYTQWFDMKNARPSAPDLPEQPKYQASPIVLDLDGDGVETMDIEDGVHFDHDGNRFAEKSGWVGSDDALLIRDRNRNGAIDGGGELFGSNTVLANESKAANGFVALAEMDSNRDGIVNHLDAGWGELKLWQDKDSDGILDAGEMLTMEETGVTGINIGYKNQSYTDENGNQHKQTGTFIRDDGTTGNMADVWFKTDLSDTLFMDEIEVNADISKLPNLRGYGNMPSLHQAMALDESGRLKALMGEFISSNPPAASKKHASFWLVIFSVLGALIFFPATQSQAKLDRERLIDVVSGLDVIHARLTYQATTLLYSDDEKPAPYRLPPSQAFLGFEEITQALESSLVGATAEDRAKTGYLFQSLHKLNSVAEAYISQEVALDDNRRKNLHAIFQRSMPGRTEHEATLPKLNEVANQEDKNPAHKKLVGLADLKIQYEIALSQVRELREYFSNQLQ